MKKTHGWWEKFSVFLSPLLDADLLNFTPRYDAAQKAGWESFPDY